jgi:hypothetical protein
MQQNISIVIVHAHGRPVHDLDDLAVYAPGHNVQLAPEILPGFRGTLGERQFALLLAELRKNLLREGLGDLSVALGIWPDAKLGCDLSEFYGIFDLVAALAFSSEEQRMGDIAPMVGVGGRSRCDHAREIPGHDGIGIGAADAALRPLPKGVNATGPHITDAAADAQLSKTALGLLRLPAIPRRLQALLFRALEHLLRRTIYAALSHGSSFTSSSDMPSDSCRCRSLY